MSSIILVYLVAPYFYRWFDLGGQRLSKVLYETSYNQASLMVQKACNFRKADRLPHVEYKIKNPLSMHSAKAKGKITETKTPHLKNHPWQLHFIPKNVAIPLISPFNFYFSDITFFKNKYHMTHFLFATLIKFKQWVKMATFYYFWRYESTV